MIELEKRMIRSVTTIILAGILLAGCEPTATRPGFWVSGEVENFPSDWAFSDEFKTIGLEKGFLLVASSPLTRSSYDADKDFETLIKARRMDPRHGPETE